MLPLRARAINSTPHGLPLFFYDAAPDGWGKAVLTFAYPDQKWGMAEFLAVAGEDRTGDLLFGPDPAGPERFVPGRAMIDLPEEESSLEALLEAAEAMDRGQPRRHHLDLLFRGSADVGGGRPKTRVRRDGRSWIAKSCLAARDGLFWRLHRVFRQIPIRLAPSRRIRGFVSISAPRSKFTMKWWMA